MGLELAALRLGFEAGLYSRDDVRAWVDREIAARDQLPAGLLELATIARKRHDEVVSLLQSLEGDVPEAELARLEIAVVAELYRRGELDLGGAVYALEQIATWTPGVVEADRAIIYDLVRAYDVAEFGRYGSVEGLRKEIDEFMARYRLPPLGGE